MRRFVLALSLWSLIASAGGCTDSHAPPAGEETYSLTWGPVAVAPGFENTQCIWLRLGNTTEIKVHQMHNVISPSSHHVIVYKDDMDTVEQTTPVDCQPFTGALNASGHIAPVMITQNHDDNLTLPDGVAYTLAPHQMIKLEMHYINATEATTMATATVDLVAADVASIHDEADILFIGSPDITLAPNAMATLNAFFSPTRAQLDLSTAKFFAITGHTHKLGTNVTVNTAATIGGEKTPVYDPNPFVWSEPVTQTHQPEFMLPPGGGFDFTCSYYNSSSATVKFGESANNEMCFFWAYYYPSKGAHVCFHSTQLGGVDLCCPDAGSLCNGAM